MTVSGLDVFQSEAGPLRGHSNPGMWHDLVMKSWPIMQRTHSSTTHTRSQLKFFSFERGPYVAQANLELTVRLKMALNSQSSCLYFSSLGMTGMVCIPELCAGQVLHPLSCSPSCV